MAVAEAVLLVPGLGCFVGGGAAGRFGVTVTARRDCLGRPVNREGGREPWLRWQSDVPQPDWTQAACDDDRWPASWWDAESPRAGRGRHERQVHVDTARAVQVCRACPIVDGCLRYAIDAGMDYMVWGGMLPEQRKELRRRWRL